MGAGVTVLIGLMLATLAVLIAGVMVMARGGKLSEKYGNRLMVMRVSLQGLAILLLVALAVAW